jgi:FKBP-type peptidyl-prolyl cis-trans isomerase FkpA
MMKLPLIAAFAAVLALTACGGGSDDNSGPATPAVSSPAALTKTDNTVGTGAEAVPGKRATVQYTLWLYNANAADFKGKQMESSSFTFTLGSRETISGFDQGVTGMKVGGKRTILIPSALGYGASGNFPIPPNSGLVFEVTLNKID